MRSSAPMRSTSSPSGSAAVRSSSARISLIRSSVARIRVTALVVTGRPSRKRPMSVSAACASDSSRGNPRNPQVPLIVWTKRKMFERIFSLLGSCSKRTSSTSTVSRCSLVSVRNSRSSSSMECSRSTRAGSGRDRVWMASGLSSVSSERLSTPRDAGEYQDSSMIARGYPYPRARPLKRART